MDFSITGHIMQGGVNSVSKQFWNFILTRMLNALKWGMESKNLTGSFWDLSTWSLWVHILEIHEGDILK